MRRISLLNAKSNVRNLMKQNYYLNNVMNPTLNYLTIKPSSQNYLVKSNLKSFLIPTLNYSTIGQSNHNNLIKFKSFLNPTRKFTTNNQHLKKIIAMNQCLIIIIVQLMKE